MDSYTAEAVLNLWEQIVIGKWYFDFVDDKYVIVLSTTEDDYIYPTIYEASEACLETIATWANNMKGAF